MCCACSVCPPTDGCLVIGVVITIVSEAGGGGQQRFEIMNSWSRALLIYYRTARHDRFDSTIDNDFSPTESYVVVCPCDKGSNIGVSVDVHGSTVIDVKNMSDLWSDKLGLDLHILLNYIYLGDVPSQS
jgi:hypothetical protein